jgi:AraC family transcriptional regulator
MDLYDIFAGHDSWHTQQLLEAARSLSDDQLDRPLNNPVQVVPWDTPDQTLRDILDRIEFQKVFRGVRDCGTWTDTFVDKYCEPPEAFTFGGMFAHVVTFNSYRRLLAMDPLRRMGAQIDGSGCPMDYERVLVEAAAK